MKLPCLLTAISTIIFSVAALGQANYQPGFVVKKNGDTLRGYIDHKEWPRNPKVFSFKNTLTDKSVLELGLKEINFLKVDEQEFVYYEGPVSMDENGIRLAASAQFASANDSVFLKVLTSGPHMTLLQLRDKIKTRFFISIKNQKPVELIYHHYTIQIPGTSRISAQEVNQYKTQLMLEANAQATNESKIVSESFQFRIKHATYNANVLTEIVNRINDKQPPPKKSAALFYLGTGASFTTISYVPAGRPTEKSPARPWFSAGVDFFGNGNVRRFGFRGELSFASASFSVLGSKQSTVSLATQVLYNAYNGKNLKFYLAPGVRMNVSSYTDTKYNNFEATPFYFNIVLQAGLVINQRIDVNASFVPQLYNTLASNYVEILHIARVGVNYHFASKKKR